MPGTDDIFITAIEIEKLRHLANLTIPVSETERRHLILTGANGSGKTSLLEVMHFQLGQILKNGVNGGSAFRLNGNEVNVILEMSDSAPVIKNHFRIGQLAYHFFPADRNARMNPAEGVKKLEWDRRRFNEAHAVHFLQFVVNLKAERSFARDDNDTATVAALDQWFERFERLLGDLYADPGLRLEFKRETYDFFIHTRNREPFSLRTLSRGYNAILAIVSEIMMRVENPRALAYETQGIVLIDEIETHLHIELQKRILPFLTSLFPKIQFIVTTHSPFVLTSIDDAVVFDLERQQRVEDLWLYSSEALVEDYFQSDKYSTLLKARVAEYIALAEKAGRTPAEEQRWAALKAMFANVSWNAAPELFVKLQELELDAIAQ